MRMLAAQLPRDRPCPRAANTAHCALWPEAIRLNA
jgi:hypothetical protein